MRNRWKRFDSDDREAGFTLIELMVVVLIIAILIAIAIPTFLGAREKAQDRAAQSNLRNALASVNLYYTDDGTYAGITKDAMELIEPSLQWVDGLTVAADSKELGVQPSASAEAVCVTAESGSGTHFTIIDVKQDFSATAPAGTYYLEGTPIACDAAAASSGSQDGF
jgi:type IV pilus assembly protein PilA